MLVMMFPFIGFIFIFLDAEEVVTRILTHGLNGVIATINMGAQSEQNLIDKGKEDMRIANEKNQVFSFNHFISFCFVFRSTQRCQLSF